jgi:mono/diheme cytochrome c family protein
MIDDTRSFQRLAATAAILAASLAIGNLALGLAAAVNVLTLRAALPVEVSKLPPATTRKVDFVKDIQPIFAENCYACHSAKKQEAAFRLDHKPTVFKGGDLGPAIVPGKPDESLLIKAVRYTTEDLKMPPSKKLDAPKIAALTKWVEIGAPWPGRLSHFRRRWR